MSNATTRTPDGMDLDFWLQRLMDVDGADLYVTVGSPPLASVGGELIPLGTEAFSQPKIEVLLQGLFTPSREKAFAQKPELDLAYESAGKGRFRINVYRQRGLLAMVARRVKTEVPTLDGLELPAILKELVVGNRGLIFVTGAAGVGKSTTLAAMLEHRNRSRTGHIVTIEDPIEYLFAHKRSIFSQREVGRDTQGFADALKSVLRQAPSAVLIGEVRDRETAEALLHVSETGHLVLTTLHAANSVQTIERFVGLFDRSQREQILQHLSLELTAILCQRLVPGTHPGKRHAALEVLVATPRAKDLIAKGDLQGLIESMAEAKGNSGIQTFEDALFALIEDGKVRLQEALAYADSAANLRLRVQLKSQNQPKRGRQDLRLI